MANILLIDDEPVLLDVVSNTLRHDGHDVTAMGNPLSALLASYAGGNPIDLVLTDIDTKPISGFEVVRRLTRKGFDGSVLFMSEYPSLAAAVAQSLGNGPSWRSHSRPHSFVQRSVGRCERTRRRLRAPKLRHRKMQVQLRVKS